MKSCGSRDPQDFTRGLLGRRVTNHDRKATVVVFAVAVRYGESGALFRYFSEGTVEAEDFARRHGRFVARRQIDVRRIGEIGQAACLEEPVFT